MIRFKEFDTDGDRIDNPTTWASRRRAPARRRASACGPAEDGFSLIELMVVMLILAVLASISLTIFYAQSKKAHRAQADADGQMVTIELTAVFNEYNSLGSASAPIAQADGAEAITVGPLSGAAGPDPTGPGAVPAHRLSPGSQLTGSTRIDANAWCTTITVSGVSVVFDEHGRVPDATACVAGVAS